MATILVCDDSPTERITIAAYLRELGYEIQEASGGEEALQLLKATEVAMILLDLHMPATSGFEVLAYLQEHRRSLPVIVLSGMPVDDIQHEIHTLPLRQLPPLLLKPIDLELLTQLIALQLNGEMPDLNNAQPVPAPRN